MNATGENTKIENTKPQKSLMQKITSKLFRKKKGRRPSEEMLNVPPGFFRQFSETSRQSMDSIASFEEDGEQRTQKQDRSSLISDNQSHSIRSSLLDVDTSPTRRRSVIESLYNMQSSASQEGLDSTADLGDIFQLLPKSPGTFSSPMQTEGDHLDTNPQEMDLSVRMSSVMRRIGGTPASSPPPESAPRTPVHQNTLQESHVGSSTMDPASCSSPVSPLSKGEKGADGISPTIPPPPVPPQSPPPPLSPLATDISPHDKPVEMNTTTATTTVSSPVLPTSLPTELGIPHAGDTNSMCQGGGLDRTAFDAMLRQYPHLGKVRLLLLLL